MSKRRIEIDEQLYLRAAAKAEEESQDLAGIIEDYLRTWVESTPSEPVVPPPPAEPILIRTETYAVHRGDTLAQIAKRMYGDAKKYVLIAEHNNITDPTVIRVGQELLIPFYGIPDATLPAPRPFRFPLDKIETNYYRFGSLYNVRSRWAGKPHPGVDFHDHKGANVYAMGEGTVLVNRQDPRGYGHYIMIEHTLTTGEKVYSLYGHLMYDDDEFESPLVGTELKGEDIVIGKEGDTGYAGVPHVHFEVKKSAKLGLYATITTYNIDDHFYDPYTFIQDPDNRYLPA
jgi:murein DD-endopeptidase MepM/ murein hydrolase activator NlpD